MFKLFLETASLKHVKTFGFRCLNIRAPFVERCFHVQTHGAHFKKLLFWSLKRILLERVALHLMCLNSDKVDDPIKHLLAVSHAAATEKQE